MPVEIPGLVLLVVLPNNNISSSFFDKIDQRGRLGGLSQSYDRRNMAADRSSSSSLLPKTGGESFDTRTSYEGRAPPAATGVLLPCLAWGTGTKALSP